jgi:uncharacterized protein YjbJ (UPF0337 family)
MNEQIIKGKWNQAKGALQSMWGKLSSDELEKTKGNIKDITGLIQDKYGHSKEEISAKITEIVDKLRGQDPSKDSLQ